MATSNQQHASEFSEGNGSSRVQAVRVNYDYAPAEPDHPLNAALPTSDETCCLCFDIRSGIIILGVWLLIESVLTVILWFAFMDEQIEQSQRSLSIAVLVLGVFFDVLGGTLGVYGAYKRSSRLIFLFYIFGIIRCIFSLLDALLSFVYLLVFAVWFYWTMVIRKYYKMLVAQQLAGNQAGYARYDANRQENDQFDTNNPYAATNEGH